MNVILSNAERIRIAKIEALREKLNNDYLTDITDTQTSFIAEQFLRTQVKESNCSSVLSKTKYLPLLNISFSLPYTLASTIADYVGVPNTNYEIDIEEAIMAYSWAGYCVFMVSTDTNGNTVVSTVEPDEYVQYRDREAVYSYYEHSGKVYIFEISFYALDNGKYVRENKLFKVDKNMLNEFNEIQGEEVPLYTIPETEGYEEIEYLGITRSPLIKLHNTRLRKSPYGSSDVEKVLSLISSVEIDAVNIKDQLLKHLSAKLIMPKSGLSVDPITGMANVKGMEVIGVEGGEVEPKYLTNMNSYIPQGFVNIQMSLKQICAILKIPAEFFPVTISGGAESSETKEIRMGNFVKRVQKIRQKTTKALRDINRIALELGAKDAVEDSEFIVVWNEIFPKDKHKEALELQVARSSGIISQLHGIMRYQDIQQTQAEEELKRINTSLQETNETTITTSNARENLPRTEGGDI